MQQWVKRQDGSPRLSTNGTASARAAVREQICAGRNKYSPATRQHFRQVAGLFSCVNLRIPGHRTHVFGGKATETPIVTAGVCCGCLTISRSSLVWDCLAILVWGRLVAMKGAVVLKKLRQAAKAKGQSLSMVELTRHTAVKIGRLLIRSIGMGRLMA